MTQPVGGTEQPRRDLGAAALATDLRQPRQGLEQPDEITGFQQGTKAVAIVASRVGELALCGREHAEIPSGEANPALVAQVAKNVPCFFFLRYCSIDVLLPEGYPST